MTVMMMMMVVVIMVVRRIIISIRTEVQHSVARITCEHTSWATSEGKVSTQPCVASLSCSTLHIPNVYLWIDRFRSASAQATYANSNWLNSLNVF